jgi:hypothetical protein
LTGVKRVSFQLRDEVGWSDFNAVERNQRVVIRFLTNESVDAQKIVRRRSTRFEKHASTVRTVPFWMPKLHGGREDLRDEHRASRPLQHHRHAKIMPVWQKKPTVCDTSLMGSTLPISNSSLMQIYDMISIPRPLHFPELTSNHFH